MLVTGISKHSVSQQRFQAGARRANKPNSVSSGYIANKRSIRSIKPAKHHLIFSTHAKETTTSRIFALCPASADEIPTAGTLIVERRKDLMPDFALIDKLSGRSGSELIIRDERRPDAFCFFRFSSLFSGGCYYEPGSPVCLP